MQDLHQVSNALFPDIEGMLPGRAGHNVFTITGKATALPRSPNKESFTQTTQGIWKCSHLSKRDDMAGKEQWKTWADTAKARVSSDWVMVVFGHQMSDLLTRSCSFCMGSGSPSRPQVSISLPSYTRMMRSAVFIRKQLYGTKHQEGFHHNQRWRLADSVKEGSL